MTRGKDRRLALGRLGALVEQLEALVRSGREVILVTSGGVNVGKQKLMQQRVLNSSPLEMQMNNDGYQSIKSETFDFKFHFGLPFALLCLCFNQASPSISAIFWSWVL